MPLSNANQRNLTEQQRPENDLTITKKRRLSGDRQGRIQRGAHPARAPPKIGKNKIFWRKIVIFHTKYPKNVRASLRSVQFF
jgi:hypothetical protein